MKRIIELAKGISAIVAAFLALCTLVGWLNQAILEHLDRTFATRSDMTRIETKIDKLSTHVDSLDTRLFDVTRTNRKHP